MKIGSFDKQTARTIHKTALDILKVSFKDFALEIEDHSGRFTSNSLTIKFTLHTVQPLNEAAIFPSTECLQSGYAKRGSNARFFDSRDTTTKDVVILSSRRKNYLFYFKNDPTHKDWVARFTSFKSIDGK